MAISNFNFSILVQPVHFTACPFCVFGLRDIFIGREAEFIMNKNVFLNDTVPLNCVLSVKVLKFDMWIVIRIVYNDGSLKFKNVSGSSLHGVGTYISNILLSRSVPLAVSFAFGSHILQEAGMLDTRLGRYYTSNFLAIFFGHNVYPRLKKLQFSETESLPKVTFHLLLF